ncbi:hypothetical protein PtB15_9B622 [Puccinia triticina]|nr:hypothetical protein PtB15_9B622 [Puccinia triticina]
MAACACGSPEATPGGHHAALRPWRVWAKWMAHWDPAMPAVIASPSRKEQSDPSHAHPTRKSVAAFITNPIVSWRTATSASRQMTTYTMVRSTYRADAQGNQSQGPPQAAGPQSQGPPPLAEPTLDQEDPTTADPLQYEDDLVDSRFWNDIEATTNNASTIDDKLEENDNPQPPVNPDADWQEVMNNELHNISLAPAGIAHSHSQARPTNTRSGQPPLVPIPEPVGTDWFYDCWSYPVNDIKDKVRQDMHSVAC